MRPNAEEDVTEGYDSLSLHAYQRIKRAIVTCEIRPGSEVTEAQLTALTGLSKAPVRSGLARLSHEGLLRPVPRRGYLVSPITLQDVQEIFQLRLLLEPQAARLAAGRLSEAHLRQLYAAVAQPDPGATEAADSFLRSNKTFHVTIASATGNQRLAASVAALLDEVERMLHLIVATRDRTQQFREEHRELLTALVTGDANCAEQLAYAQIRGGQELLITSMLKMPNAAASIPADAP